MILEQRILITENINEDLTISMSECEHDKTFVLTDENTARCCWPVISKFIVLRQAQLITIPAGDTHKSLESLTAVWRRLSESGATRHSLLINLGGGMVTDLGGFAAATFKRGINFINIPTTLLAMVDASVGGKTGINFNGLKNEIGAFCNASCVLMYMGFLKSLDTGNLRSGYAEMLKHGLLADRATWAELVNFNLAEPDYKALGRMIASSVQLKERIVKQDPKEKGLRKALNLGHTFGHALESLAMKRRPILHGYAVAYGLVCELYLSSVRCHFPTDSLRQTVTFIRDYYGQADITCDDYDTLIELMHHDKKNLGDKICCTLLSDFGKPVLDQILTPEDIKEALDFLREGL